MFSIRARFVSIAISIALVTSACGSGTTPTSPTQTTAPVASGPSVEPLVVTTSELPPAVRGQVYTSKVEAVGGKAPLTFAADGLPSGLVMSPDGLITGVPITAGAFEIAVITKDAINETGGKILPLSVSTPKVAVFGTPAEVAANGGYGISVEVLRIHPAAGATILPLLDMKAGTADFDYWMRHCAHGADPQNRCYAYTLRFVNSTGEAARATLGFARGASGPIIVGFRNQRTQIAAIGETIIKSPEDGQGPSIGSINLGSIDHLIVEVGGKRFALDMGYTTAR